MSAEVPDPVREQARVLLEQKPDIPPSEFAGAVASDGVGDFDTALELYDELRGGGDDRDSSGGTAEVSVSDHYRRLDDSGLYQSLGATDGAFCLGNQDFTGWYYTRGAGGAWDGEARAYALPKEFDVLRDGLDRVLYSTVNYVDSRWFMDAWTRYRWERDGESSSREWGADESPTPEYGDITAYAPFADIDLADDVKVGRPDGDIPQADIETALERYVEAFADLAGDVKHVFALDSVGGAYVFIAPAATRPIAEAFGREDRERLFDELTDRLNEWLADVSDEIAADVGLEGVFEADAVNHKNRLYKAPLSVHSSLDGVVTPINPVNVSYEFTPVEDVDEQFVERTTHWARAFTNTGHAEAVDSIVATLWADEYADAGGWCETLREWLEADEQVQEQTTDGSVTIPPEEIPDDLETTDELEVVKSTIENINVADLAKSLSSGVNDDRDPMRFDPSWRTSSTGESCFADRDKFVDLKEGGGGGALKLVALDRGIISIATADLRGDDYWRAVEALREEGYSIPLFEGHDGKHADVLRLHKTPEDDEERKRQTMRALLAGH